MRKLLIFGILAAAVAAVVVMTSMRPAPPKKERVELDPLVEVLVLEEMTANFEVRSQGTVRPRTETILSAEVSGTITDMSPKFVAGGVFKKNEVMARIDHARAALTGSSTEVGKSDITRRMNSDVETKGDDLDSGTHLTWLLKRIEAAGWPNLQGGKFEVWATVSRAQSELIDQRAQIGQLKQELEKLRPFQSAIERLSAEDDPIEDIQNG